jgi:hypothetical protein
MAKHRRHCSGIMGPDRRTDDAIVVDHNVDAAEPSQGGDDTCVDLGSFEYVCARKASGGHLAPRELNRHSFCGGQLFEFVRQQIVRDTMHYASSARMMAAVGEIVATPVVAGSRIDDFGMVS